LGGVRLIDGYQLTSTVVCLLNIAGSMHVWNCIGERSTCGILYYKNSHGGVLVIDSAQNLPFIPSLSGCSVRKPSSSSSSKLSYS
jgi:hypothetical protein